MLTSLRSGRTSYAPTGKKRPKMPVAPADTLLVSSTLKLTFLWASLTWILKRCLKVNCKKVHSLTDKCRRREWSHPFVLSPWRHHASGTIQNAYRHTSTSLSPNRTGAQCHKRRRLSSPRPRRSGPLSVHLVWFRSMIDNSNAYLVNVIDLK